MKIPALLMALGSAVALASPVGAAIFTNAQVNEANRALEAMRKLNVITFGDLNENSHVQGKTFVGGSLYGSHGATGDSNASFGQGNSSAGAKVSSYATLTVANSTYASFSLSNGSNGGVGNVSVNPSVDVGKNLTYTNNVSPDGWAVRVGDTLAGFQSVNSGLPIHYGVSYSGSNTGGGRISQAAAIAPGGAKDLGANLAGKAQALTTSLSDLSTMLATLPSNGTMTTLGSNVTFDFSGVAPTDGYAAYTISAATLFAYNGNLNVVLGADTLGAVINVTGSGTYDDWLNMGLADSVAQKLIFNFTDATGLNLHAQFTGSILAPKATLQNSNNINGSVVAKLFNQDGEVHLGTFNGQLPLLVTTPNQPPTGVPEPASWATMLAGFGAIGGMIRRRRAQERKARIVA